jgi:hypothetical protein
MNDAASGLRFVAFNSSRPNGLVEDTSPLFPECRCKSLFYGVSNP